MTGSSESSAMSYEPNKPKSNRRFHAPSNPWLPYIGDCSALEKYLKSKDGIAWVIPKYLNALLRGISQVVFANNPLSGLIILVALFWTNVFVGLAAVVAATVAIITSVMMRQDSSSISAGLTTYNAVLIGTVTSSLWTPLYGEALSVKMWVFIILGAALSVFVTSAISNMLSSYKISLPALTVPFNIVIVLLFISLMPKNLPNDGSGQLKKNSSDPVALRLSQSQDLQFSAGLNDRLNDGRFRRSIMTSSSRLPRKAEDMTNEPTTDFENDDNDKDKILNWGNLMFVSKILSGIVVSSGQVFGVYDEIGSVLIYVAIMVYSPILFMMSVFGAILGTVFGIFFTPAPYQAVYTGIWGYNGLLSASSVGGFFIVLTCHSFWNALVNVIFTVLVQQTLAIIFKPINLPVFTIPFVLSTLLFLSVTTAGNHMPRVEAITYPEMHRYNYLETSRVRNRNKDSTGVIGNEVADDQDQELALTDVKVINHDQDENVVVAIVETGKDGSEDDN